MILLKIVRYYILKTLKRFYWFFLLIKTIKGQNLSIEFPVKLGGKINLSFGDNCSISKNAFFACMEGGQIIFGDNCSIGENVEIVAGVNTKIVFENNCSVMKNTIIRATQKFLFEDNVVIASNCAIFSREKGFGGKLIVGEGTHIGDYTIIDLADNFIIEKEVAIGPNCVIYTHDHDYNIKEKAAWKGGVITRSILIKTGAWVGSNVTLLPGIEIGKRCVIAAGAVVTKATKENSIYGGIPAIKLKNI